MKNINSKISLILVQVVLLSQIVAAPLIDCNMTNDSQSESHNMQLMQHDMNINSKMEMPCCDDSCDCPIGFFMTVAITNDKSIELQFTGINLLPISINPFHLKQPRFAIFHPPIFS